MSLGKSVADIRKDYMKGSLNESEVSDKPLLQFEKWFSEAVNSEVNEPNAMSLATAVDGRPSLRIVLLKGFDENGLVFFTNYESKKSREIEANPHVALTFFWPELERQVRVEGRASRISEADSDEYYQSRDRMSRIGAWASPQSSTISDRDYLEKRVDEMLNRFGEEGHIPKPEHWGGFVVKPYFYEFWQGRPSRLHDRIVYEWTDEKWKISRLAP